MLMGYTAVLQQRRGALLHKKTSKTCRALAVMNQDGFLPKSIQSTASALVSNLCLLPRGDEPWYQHWRDFLGSWSVVPGEGIKANPEKKQMLGPPLSQCWRGDLCCKNDVLSFNTSRNRVLRNVLCWKCDGCLSVSRKTFWATLGFTAFMFFALIRTASVPNNLNTVAFVFLVSSCHMIICHNHTLWSVPLFYRLHLSFPVPQSFPLWLPWLQITPLSLGREQYLFLENIKKSLPKGISPWPGSLIWGLQSCSSSFNAACFWRGRYRKRKGVLKNPVVLQVEKFLEFYTVLTFCVMCFSSRHLIWEKDFVSLSRDRSRSFPIWNGFGRSLLVADMMAYPKCLLFWRRYFSISWWHT